MMENPSEQFGGTMPVGEKQRFDAARLQAYLRERIEGFAGTLEVEQFKGGQSNPTFRLSAGGKRYVLRRKPPGKLLPSAHAVDREYRIIAALAGSDVPVPKAYCLCEDDDVIGTAFYIMDYVEGRVLWNPGLPGLSAAERSAIYADMIRVIVALHRVDYAAAGLADYGKAGNYFARQIARWTRQYRASETERIEAMERLIEWLPANIPAVEETTLVHGDYRLDNLIFHPTEPRVLAVLDWELSTLGHPLADFSYQCMGWHLPPGPFRGLVGHDLAELGIPSEADYVTMYCRNSGRGDINPHDWDFYLAYNMFRGAGILQGIMGRVKDGTASGQGALEAGRAAKAVADSGWRQVEKILRRR